MPLTSIAVRTKTDIAVGGLCVRMRASDPRFLDLLDERYVGFTGDWAACDCELDIDLVPPAAATATDTDLRVHRRGQLWMFDRGDFYGEWDPESRRGRIRQSANPYSIDSALRIIHTLVLAEGQSGFLLHAASAVRDGRAFAFTGVSGAGKTTMTRLAPPDVTLLTDEISYIRRGDELAPYFAYGTPFAGELAKVGENVRAPLAAIYVLDKGPENRIDDIPRSSAAWTLMRNVLFFAEDSVLVERVFDLVCDLVEHVPVRRLTFAPNNGVWELIR